MGDAKNYFAGAVVVLANFWSDKLLASTTMSMDIMD
jgi:hypothetical protein